MKRSAGVIAAFSLLALIGLWRVPETRTQTRSDAGPVPRTCTWIPGDLHIRSAEPGRATGLGADAAAPLSLSQVADVARARELEYVLIADRERLPAVEDPTFGSGGLSWLIGFEKVTARGSLVLGGQSLSIAVGGDSVRSLMELARDVHSTGGFVQLGRPETARWSPRLLDKLKPDTIEVWRGGPFSYRGADRDKNTAEALRIYDSLLDRGQRIGVAGGSDAASRVVSDVAGPGQPTTWVCADESSVGGLIGAITEGRTTISHESPSRRPPLVFIEGDQDGDGDFEERMGESLPGRSTLRVTVRNAAATRLRLITKGSKLLHDIVVDSFDFTTTLTAPRGAGWVRAEVYLDETLVTPQDRLCPDLADLERGKGRPVGYCNGLIAMLAISSPIYIE